MNFVIPMAGAGSRFATAGYEEIKPLLRVGGKTLLEWSVDSLPLSLSSNLVFIGLHRDRQKLEALIREKYRQFSPMFVWLEKVTRGQSETVIAAAGLLDGAAPLAIFNVDTAFSSPTLKARLAAGDDDGVIGCFHSAESRFSYARVDPEGFVIEVREKSVISKHALTGFYHFARADDFVRVASDAIRENDQEKGEFYVAPLYNRLIAEGKRFVLDEVSWMRALGTPEEYEAFRVEQSNSGRGAD